ncbi:hypothetical protein C8R47DRAFT_1211939 [Mycena vitilis]|nr:hypothetical protein C8R47DRAFT_1211939 [Mycena vitilis]
MPPLSREPAPPFITAKLVPIRPPAKSVAKRGHRGRLAPRSPHRGGRDPNLPSWAMNSRPNSLQDFNGQWWDCPAWAANGWGAYPDSLDASWAAQGWGDGSARWWPEASDTSDTDAPVSSMMNPMSNAGWGDADGGWGPGGWPDASDTPAPSSPWGGAAWGDADGGWGHNAFSTPASSAPVASVDVSGAHVPSPSLSPSPPPASSPSYTSEAESSP